MSGRVKVTLASGRRVTGYRKTERTLEHRSEPRVRPMLRIAFQAPARLLLAPAPTGVIGVSVKDPGPMLEVVGAYRDWMFKQLRVFLDKIEAPNFSTIAVNGEVDRPGKAGRLSYSIYTGIEWNGRSVA